MTVMQNPGRITRTLNRLVLGTSNPALPNPAIVGASIARETAVDPPESPAPTLAVPDDHFNVRITGIGGTGVVTVAQVLGTAAMFEGYEVSGLDQIGLSQKAGPVVSDLRLARGDASHTNRLGAGQAHLLLAFDQLVAASPKGLDACDAARTIVVGSNSATPTGEMVTSDAIELPSADDLAAVIGQRARGTQYWTDAEQVCTSLFGSSSSANIFVIGMAVQAGALPISAENIERAIELNGVAVSTNIAAFRWGRAQVANPLATTTHVDAPVRGRDQAALPADVSERIVAIPEELATEAHLSMLARELVAWGGAKAAHRWLDSVVDVADALAAVATGGTPLNTALADTAWINTALVDAVASGLHKLLAYKDEYEVARLMMLPEALAEAQDLAGAQGSVSWQLHPPVLRSMGMERKISVPAWATPVVRALAKARWLRGTPADPFGWAGVRRTERKLIGEYEAAIQAMCKNLSAQNYGYAVALAKLPDMVRGYEDIKLKSVVEYRRALDTASAELSRT